SHKLIKPELEEGMARVREVAAVGLALRKASNLKVRQPLARLFVKTPPPSELFSYIQDEVNVKEVVHDPTQKEEVRLDGHITPELKWEGLAREISRSIQEMRKDAGYNMDQHVRAAWQSDNADIKEAIERYNSKIIKDVLL